MISDLEICKRVAEIEGVTLGAGLLEGMFLQDNNSWTYYNPLKDDALCFKLMVKYEIHMNIDHGSKVWNACDGAGHYENIHYNKCPRKALCLTIIELNKEELDDKD